jgi:CheY-like chemotaxis protein
MLSRVFDMFTQLDRSSARSQGGLGIGLTLVKSLVEMHGGRVSAWSAGPGQGSEFTLRLPLALPAPGVPAQSAARASGDWAAYRVLVVDDNRDAADSLAALLLALGSEVRTAYDGPSALAALNSYRPALVLLDLGMPGMDGYEVARRIRQEARYRDMLLVALTGWGQEEDRRRSREAGFDQHLVKPVAVEALQAVLAALRPGRRP